jgi:OOP family OmpA-OmpF porin
LEDYNLNLSQKRAEEVKNYLLKNGISNLITAKGLGESKAKYDNTNAIVKTKNRRVEIYFINDAE